MASSQARILQRKVAALMDTAEALFFRMLREDPAPSLSDPVLISLWKQVKDFPSKAELPASTRTQLDNVSTELWNGCVHTENRFIWDNEERNSRSVVRAMACSLINIAASSEASGHIRALKVAFTACRFCIGSEQKGLVLRILKAGAQRLDRLQSLDPPIDPVQLDTITAEYYMLRAHLARMQGRLDIAEHLYSKIPPTGTLDRQDAVIELCYAIGNDASVAQQYENATEWLEEACAKLDALTADQSQEKSFKDLDLRVRHRLVRVYLKTIAPAETEKLKEQLRILKREHGDTQAVLLLNITLIRREENPNADELFRVLNAIINCMALTESSVELVFQHIKWSKRFSIGLAMESLLSLILRLPTDMRDLIEKCTIGVVAMAATMAFENKLPDQTSIDFIKRVAQSVEARRLKSLSCKAAHAALILVWRQVDMAFRQNRSYVAEKWCQLVLSGKIFENISTANRFKIKRKLFAIAMKDSNVPRARQILNQMISECSSHADARILYLNYKLGLKEGSDIFVDPAQTPFAAFKLEAERMTRKESLTNCVQSVIEQTQVDGGVREVLTVVDKYLFPLFLLDVELKKGYFDRKNVEMALNLFLMASREAKSGYEKKSYAFSASEFEWLCSKCFVLARELLSRGDAESAKGLLSSMSDLAGVYKYAPQSKLRKVKRLAYLIPFLEMIMHAILARSSAEHAAKTLEYGEMLKCINVINRYFYPSIRSETSSPTHSAVSTPTHPEMWKIFQITVAMQFEAAIFLHDWDGLHFTLSETYYRIDKVPKANLMHFILFFDIPHHWKVYCTTSIISSMHKSTSLNESLRIACSRYLHVLFQLCITGATSSEPPPENSPIFEFCQSYLTLAEWVIDQAIATAGDEAYINGEAHREQHQLWNETHPDNPEPFCTRNLYPPEELEYLAIHSFNQAADFYKDEQDDDCHRWAKKAIRMAELMGNDEGKILAEMLRTRLATLC